MFTQRQLIPGLGLILLYAGLLLPYLNAPPIHRYEQTDIPQNLGTAVQHVHRGFSETYGRDYYRDGETRYLNHPGLLNVIVSGPVRWFGESYAAARSVAIVFQLLSFSLLMLIARWERHPWWLIALIFFSLPIVVVYGRDLVIFSPVLLCSIATLAVYHYARNHLSPVKWYAALGFLTFLSASFDWSGYLIFPLLAAWELETRRERGVFICLGIVAAAALGIFLWQNYMITGSALAPFNGAFGQGEHYERQIIQKYGDPYTPQTWFGQQAIFLTQNFSPPALMAAVLGLVMSGVTFFRRQRLTGAEYIGWGTLALGVGFIFLTGPFAYVHSYMHLFLIPPVFLFALDFFRRLPTRYFAVAMSLYVLTGIPVSAFLILRYYSAYLTQALASSLFFAHTGL